MEVILLQKIRKLGDLGDRVKVKPGYGRYLVPSKKAVLATPENVAHFEARRAELVRQATEVLRAAQDRADAIAALNVTIAAKAGDEGKLFGSIGTRDIADAITAAGVAVKKSEVRLPEGALRATGEYVIALHLHSDVISTVKITIVPER